MLTIHCLNSLQILRKHRINDLTFYSCDLKLYFDITSVLELEMNCYGYAIILIILYRIQNCYYQHFYGVSVRYLYNFQSEVFIWYFSYYRPVVSSLDYDNIEQNIDLQK